MSQRPPLTREHVAEWATFVSSEKEGKPTSPEELEARKDRKRRMVAFQERLLQDLNQKNGKGMELPNSHKENNDNSSPKKWTNTSIVKELNRRVEEWRRKENEWNNLPDYQKDKDHPDNSVDYREEGGPFMQYLWDTTAQQQHDVEDFEQPSSPCSLHGQTLYLGGEVGSDGHIYCIPGHAGRVLQINTQTNVVTQIGPELLTNIDSPHTSRGRLYKWLRGIVVGDFIYGLPCHADEVLKINVKTQEITKLHIPYEDFYSSPDEAKKERQQIWKYHGGTICPIDNCIYAIPQSATHVLKLDFSNAINTSSTNDGDVDGQKEIISFVGPPFPGKYKWYGGIVGKQDGAIYGIPQCAKGVLRIAPAAITIHGDFDGDNHKWHGGAAAANGVIVSVPANANNILCVTPGEEPKLDIIGEGTVVAACGRHRDDGKYKYLGAMASSVNGKVYVFPCASEYVLEVDTVHMEAKSVGPNLRDTGMETIYQNKWQNGLTCIPDGCVYGMPLSGHSLLKIDCNDTSDRKDSKDPIVNTWKLPPPRRECRDKFEGGVMTESGVMYTVPNNHKGVLRIEPANLANP